MLTSVVMDIIRGLHIVALAAGFGTGLYLDYRTASNLNKRISQSEVDQLVSIHRFVSLSFVALWISGLASFWFVSQFQLDLVSPKLWVKLGIVIIMTLNAIFIGRFVIPIMSRSVGSRLIDLPQNLKFLVFLIGATSHFCWLGALALATSRVLRVASFGEIGMFLVLLSGAIVFGLVSFLTFTQKVSDRAERFEDPFDRLHRRCCETRHLMDS